MNKVNTKMYSNIEKHGNQLNAIFNTKFEPIELCKKLRRIENKLIIETTAQCNGYYHEPSPMDWQTGRAEQMRVNEDKSDKIIESEMKKVCKILGLDYETQNAIFVNYDARGYALKIKDTYLKSINKPIYSDWGGYGILAPDLREQNSHTMGLMIERSNKRF